ncbi:MAG: metal ABC transporter permease [Treponema sp.]|nr:metal ABC transporter permease [Treponema sp.]
MTAEIIILAVIVSTACSLCGVFLVLRKMALISDAISHSVILGIALGFFLVKDLSSPVPLFGAVIAGLVTAVLTECVQKTTLVKSDTAIALVFPTLFSIGIVLITLYASHVHLDIDAVLLGEIGLAPFDRISFFSISVPRNTLVMGAILLINSILLLLFFKELKLSTFDPETARNLGFSPLGINYGLMLATSITCVGAFDSVGIVLVTALMITPPAAALLLSNNLKIVLVLAVVLAAVASVSGYFLAVAIDGNIAGAMATMCGVLFALAYVFAQWKKRRGRRTAYDTLLQRKK